jgi:ABC-type enterobactin transport system permease subunit
MSVVSRPKSVSRRKSSLWLELPTRPLLIVGIIMFAIGVALTIILVATDSSCNAASNMSSLAGISGGSASCSTEPHRFLDLSFVVMVVGAALIVVGGMFVPVLQQRDARRAAANSPAPVVPSSPPPGSPPES